MPCSILSTGVPFKAVVSCAQDLGPLGERYQAFVRVVEFVRVERAAILACEAGRRTTVVARAYRQGGVRHHHPRALVERPTGRPSVRLEQCADPQRGDLLPCVQRSSPAAPSRRHGRCPRPPRSSGRASRAIRRRSKAARNRRRPKPPNPSRKGEQRPKKQARRLERSAGDDPGADACRLPSAGDVGTKRNCRISNRMRSGYKLHRDVADGGIPLSCILTSASLHEPSGDSAGFGHDRRRVANLGYATRLSDAPEISESLGHYDHATSIPAATSRGPEDRGACAARRRDVYPETLRYLSGCDRRNGRPSTYACAVTPRCCAVMFGCSVHGPLRLLN